MEPICKVPGLARPSRPDRPGPTGRSILRKSNHQYLGVPSSAGSGR